MVWPTTADELDRWVDTVAKHPLWNRVPDPADREASRRRTSELIVHVTWTRREGLFPLADDPWQDLDFARRMTARLALAGRRPAGRPGVLRGRGGLLLAAPYLYDTLWSTLAGRERVVGPHDLDPVPGRHQRPGGVRAVRPELRPALPPGGGRGGPRAARRGRGDRLVAAAPLDRPPAGRVPAGVAGRAADPVATDGATRPALRGPDAPGWPDCCGRCGPTPASCRTDRPTRSQSVAPDGVRERLVGYLLVTARGAGDGGGRAARGHRRAPRHRRPGHRRPALKATVAAARWEPRGTTLVLRRGLRPPGGRGRAARPHRRRSTRSSPRCSGRPSPTTAGRRCGAADPRDHRRPATGRCGRFPGLPVGRRTVPAGRGPGAGTAHGRAALRRPGAGDPGAVPERARRVPLPGGPHRVPAPHP